MVEMKDIYPASRASDLELDIIATLAHLTHDGEGEWSTFLISL